MKRQIPFILIGISVGILFTFSPGTAFVLGLVLLISLALRKFSDIKDRRFIVGLFLAGFLARAVLSLGLDGLSCLVEGERPHIKGPVRDDDINIVDRTRSYLGMGDSDYYSERGYVLAQLAKGTMRIPSTSHQGQYGWHGYLHVIAAFYTLFDFSPVAVKFINCLLGALLGPVLFFLAASFFNSEIARWSALSAAFFPSLILWSASNLKDPSLFLLTALLFLLFVKIREKSAWPRRLFYGGAFALALYAHAMMRSAVYPVALIGSLLLSFLFTVPRRKFIRWAFLMLLLAGIFIGQARVRSFLEQGFARHVGHIQTRGTVYRYLPEPFYTRATLEEWGRSGKLGLSTVKYLAKAVLHYLTEPIPIATKINSFLLAAACPQMLLWYLLLLFAFRGMRVSTQWNFQETFFLLLTLGAWIFLGALTSGNVGTVFRMRDMISPYLLMFACVGIWATSHGLREIKKNPICLRRNDGDLG